MKIAPKAIESYLKKPDASHRAVLLYGPDAGLVRERAKQLASLFLGGSKDPFALTEFTASKLADDPALLADELSAINFMAPKRVITLREATDKIKGAIENAAGCFNDAVLLLVCADELSARSSLRAWFESAAAGAAIACYRDEARDVNEVIRRTFEAAGIRADSEAISYLSGQLGNDRYVTRQELEKLVTYAGESKTLTLNDVQALVDYNREASFDDLVNAVADRNLQQMDKHLALLLREGTQPVAYLRALQRYFNRLYFIRAQMAAKQESAETVIQSLRPAVFFRQVPIMTRHLQNWPLPGIAKALRLLASAELSCKTSDLPVVPASSRCLLQLTQIR